MGKVASNTILRVILRVVEDPEVREASDQDLLQRFSERREAAAFHALLRRHGPMVFDVCRGVLDNEANAEDAFQATFLTLARKAASIRKAESLGSWLHRVAYRTALQSLAQEATRTIGETQATPPMARAPAAPDGKDIDRLIKQLGSDEFEEREAATKALKRVGKPALNALHEAAKANADAEVRNRATALIMAIRDSLIRAIDLGPHVNQKLNEGFHGHREGNNLATLPTGRQSFAGIAFTVGGGVVQVGGQKPAKVEGIKMDAKVVKLHFLHACGFSGNIPRNTPIGKYVVHYDDKSTAVVDIVYGRDVVDWWVQPGIADPTQSKVAWEGQNAFSPIKLYLMTWENRHPEKRIVTLDYVATAGSPFCVAISAEH